MLISGSKGIAGSPFKVVLGHRKFVMPGFSKVTFFTLEQQQAEIQEDCFTHEKIPVRIVATISFKVPAEEQAVIDAGQRFLRDQTRMPYTVGQIAAGAVRGIVGEMTLEQIISDRTTLQEKVFEHAKSELSPQGLQVDNLNISDVQDLSPGASAIESLSAPHLAEIRRRAAEATADNDQLAAKAQQAAAAQTADYERQTEVTKAGYAAEVSAARAAATATSETAQAEADAAIAEANADRDRRQRIAQATADEQAGAAAARAQQAGPLANAKAQHDVAIESTKLAEQQVFQREQELKRDVVAPATAAAEKRIAEATADAKATTLAAEALATSNRVQVDVEIIHQLPEVARAIASGLNGSNLTILNGADGLTEIATNVVAQAKTILDTMKTVRSTAAAPSPNGAREVERVGGEGRS